MRATETPAAPVHHYVWLDALRAFPIIFVVLGHAFPVLLTGGADDSLASRVAGHVARTGGAAAVVLIVLSGYIVGGIVIRAGRSTDAWRFDLYALHRLTRLWNVLLPALVLGYIVDRGGIAIFGTAGIYGGKTSAAVFYPAERFLTDPLTARAAVLLFDQVPRNLYRGKPEAFAFDPLARHICRGILARGWDKRLTRVERQFIGLPLEHSEHIADQLDSLRYFTALGDPQTTDFARHHYKMIARFGRFPHRNEELGRTSSAAELEAVAAGNAW